MKRLVQVQEIEGDGLEALLGKNVALFCMNYIYAGQLVGVNSEDIVIKNAGIVYETGALSNTKPKDFQSLPGEEWRVRISSIESYGEMW